MSRSRNVAFYLLSAVAVFASLFLSCQQSINVGPSPDSGNPTTPTFNPPAGTYTSGQDVKIIRGATDVTVYYTTDGTVPTVSSLKYDYAVETAIAIASGSRITIRAIAVKGELKSSEGSATYTVTSAHSLSYDGNGADGGAVPAGSQSYASGEPVVVLGNLGSLVKSGWALSVWNTQPNGLGTSYKSGATLTMGGADVTLYAVWVPAYGVTYLANGATGNPPSDPNAYLSGEQATILGNSNNMQKTGFNFVGWNTQSDGTGTSYTQGGKLAFASADVVLYAKWLSESVQTYLVTYNGGSADSGSAPADSTNYQAGSLVTVQGAGSLVKANNVLKEWNTAPGGGGTPYQPGGSFTIASNTTLYAIWASSYAVVYDANGGTGSLPTDPIRYKQGATVTVLGQGNLSNGANFTFGGWNTFANGSGPTYPASGLTFTMGSAAVTLYAVWVPVPKYTVTYLGNGFTGGSAPSDSTPYLAGQTVVVLDRGTLVKTGHVFVGWTQSVDGSGTVYVPGTGLNSFNISANTSLYAKWTLAYSVLYNGNSNTGGNAPTDASSPYTAGATVTVLGNTGALARTGFFYKGWNSQADGLGTDFGSSFALNANTVLFAKWQADSAPVWSSAYAPSPADGATPSQAASLPFALSWTSAIDPDVETVYYDVYLDDGLGGSYAKVQTGLTAANCSVNATSPSRNYRWYVVARDAYGLTLSSSAAHLLTGALPSVPAAPSLAPSGTTTMDVTWNSVAGLSYLVYYSTGSVSASSAHSSSIAASGASTTTTLTGLSHGSTYNIMLTVANTYGTSGAGTTATQLLHRAPSFNTSLLSPANGAGPAITAIPASASFPLSWSGAIINPDGDSLTYDVYFDGGSGTLPGTPSYTLTSTTRYVPATGEYQAYKWKVVARDAYGFSADSGTQTFHTGYPAPTGAYIDTYADLAWTWNSASTSASTQYFNITIHYYDGADQSLSHVVGISANNLFFDNFTGSSQPTTGQYGTIFLCTAGGSPLSDVYSFSL